MDHLMPEDCVPATVGAAGDLDLLRGPGFVVAIRGMLAYPTGITFRLTLAVRGVDVTLSADYRFITGLTRPRDTYPQGVGGLLLDARVTAGGARLQVHSGDGGSARFTDDVGTRVDYGYWLALPQDVAAVTLSATWPDITDAVGIRDLPIPEIRAAAARAVTL